MCTIDGIPPKGLKCPGKKCESDGDNGIRCKCEDPYEQAEDGIHCKRKFLFAFNFTIFIYPCRVKK